MGSSDRYSANSSRKQDPTYYDGTKQDKYKSQRDAARDELEKLKKELKRVKDSAFNQQDQLLRENKTLIDDRDAFREETERLAVENRRLAETIKIVENSNTMLQAKFDHLEQRYNSIKHLDTANPMSPLPDRTKKSPSSKSSSSSTTLSGGASSSNATSKLDRAREKDRQREQRDRAKIDENLTERMGGERVGRTREMPMAYDKYASARPRRQSTSRTRYETSRRGSVDFSVPRSQASGAAWPGPHSGYGTAQEEYYSARPGSEMVDGNYHLPLSR